MHLAVESDPEGMLFPQFFKKLTKSKWNGKGDSNDSKATDLWNKYYQEILQLAKLYEGKLIVTFLLLLTSFSFIC